MITNLIDEIEQTKCDAMFDVFDSLIVEYNKYLEFDNVTEIFQEGEILDNVKERGKNDSTFLKIIKFIPRLLSELWNKLKKKFKKETPEEKKKREKTENNLRKAAEKSSKPSKLKLFGNKVIDVIKKIDIKKTAIGVTATVAVVSSGVVVYKIASPILQNKKNMKEYAAANDGIIDGSAILYVNKDNQVKINYSDEIKMLSPKQADKLLKKTKEFKKEISSIDSSSEGANDKYIKAYEKYSKAVKDIYESKEPSHYFENKWYKDFTEITTEAETTKSKLLEATADMKDTVSKCEPALQSNNEIPSTFAENLSNINELVKDTNFIYSSINNISAILPDVDAEISELIELKKGLSQAEDMKKNADDLKNQFNRRINVEGGDSSIDAEMNKLQDIIDASVSVDNSNDEMEKRAQKAIDKLKNIEIPEKENELQASIDKLKEIRETKGLNKVIKDRIDKKISDIKSRLETIDQTYGHDDNEDD